MVIRPGVPMRRRTSRACGAVWLFANVSSPVSAVLPLVFFFSLLLAHRFFFVVFFFRASAKSKKRPAFCTPPLSPLLWTVTVPLLTSNLVLIPACVPSLSPSFIHAYSYVQSCLVLCVQAQTAKTKRFFYPRIPFTLRTN